MKLIANKLNGQFFKSFLPPNGTELDGVFAAIAYGDNDYNNGFLQHCINNHYRLDIWMRYDHTVPVAPSFLKELLNNAKNNIFCKLVPDCLHSKVIWWKGYGAYIGSANLTERAWNSNIEAGIFFDESDLNSSGMAEQLNDFFENLMSLNKCVELSQEIISEQERFEQIRKERLQFESKMKDDRKIILPWEGLNFYDGKEAKNRKKDNFKTEWEAAISHIRNIANQVNEYRPSWLPADTPLFWQTDIFLHDYYYGKIRQKNNTYPYEQYHSRNSKNPQAELIETLTWWKTLPISESPSYNSNMLEDAQLIRTHLSKERIKLIKANKDDSSIVLQDLFRATRATRYYLRQMKSESLGQPSNKVLNMEERIPLFVNLMLNQKNNIGMSVIELLEYVLYDNKPELIWERIYQAGKSKDYQLPHYGINSIAEVAGWTRPEDTPPRNGRTNKALRALGYPVKISM